MHHHVHPLPQANLLRDAAGVNDVKSNLEERKREKRRANIVGNSKQNRNRE